MAIEKANPFLKPQSSNYNLEMKSPQQKSYGLAEIQKTQNTLEEDATIEKEGQAIANAFSRANNPNIANYKSTNNIVPATSMAETQGINYDPNPGKSSSATKGSGAQWGSASGIASTAISEAPGIVATFSDKPTSKKEAGGRVMSMTASGASIGTSIMPGWGTLIGAAVGAGAGLVSNIGWKKELLADNNESFAKQQAEREAELKQNYYLDKTTEQLKAEYDLYAEANGIYNT